ncbi:MAG: transposase [Paludibacteraceae bacterium]|nr:transposase [Paludibacteraceae bacterium]
MNDEKFNHTYRIASARAPWHDYNGGAYFITICTQNHEHFFGEIENGEMHLSAVGRHADECIGRIAEHHPYAQIPLYVVMPNHIHLIVIIDGDETPRNKRNTDRNGRSGVETFHETSLRGKPIEYATQMQSWLSVVIRLFKQSVTRYANQNGMPFAWQTRFHDRIVRDQNEMNRIVEYIENNVAKWELEQ